MLYYPGSRVQHHAHRGLLLAASVGALHPLQLHIRSCLGSLTKIKGMKSDKEGSA